MLLPDYGRLGGSRPKIFPSISFVWKLWKNIYNFKIIDRFCGINRTCPNKSYEIG